MMVRVQRILALIELLTQNQAYTACQLAEQLKISERTLYRDLAILREQGAELIVLEHGGYRLQKGWMLPPVRFHASELEALALGLDWVTIYGDQDLQQRASSALGKLSAVLSAQQQHNLNNQRVLIAPKPADNPSLDLSLLHQAILTEQKIQIHYHDQRSQQTDRILWPFALAYYEQCTLLIAWCELRQDFRHFRCDHMIQFVLLPQKYPNTRRGLHQLWLQKMQSTDIN